MTAKDLYVPLPVEIQEDKNLVQVPTDPSKFVTSFMKRVIPAKDQKTDGDDTETPKMMMMDLAYKTQNKATVVRKKKKSHKKVMSVAQKKKMKLFDIVPEHQNYADFEPLHHLWVDYARDNLGAPYTGDQTVLEQKLLKTDLHGCILTVTKSKCPSYIGTSGILIQETKNVFKIITKANRIKVIPKLKSVFTASLDGLVITIYGSNFRYRSSERAVRKFKAKPCIDL